MMAQVVYIGGAFTHVDGQPRNHLASLDVLNGTLTSWNPDVDGIVYAMQLALDTIYVSGDFTMVGNSARNNLASFALPTGSLTPWNPNANGAVRTMDLQNNTAYVGGEFTTIGVTAVPHVGGVSTQGTGSLITCIPNGCDADVRTLRVHGSVLWVGGDFGQIGGSARERLAALNYSSCGATSWDPSADGQVNCVSEGSGTEVHVAGSFLNVGGQFRQGVAEISKSTGNATAWNANCDGEGHCLAANDRVLFVGGQFEYLGGQPRNGLGAVRLSDGSDAGWDPELENSGNPVVVHGLSTRGIGIDYVFAGGDFQTVGGVSHPYFAAWSGTFTDIYEVDDTRALTTYPSPCDGLLNIGGTFIGAYSVRIDNTLGQRVLTCAFAGTIDITSLAPGTYSVTVLDDRGIALARSKIVRH